jgi:hypothetical protein
VGSDAAGAKLAGVHKRLSDIDAQGACRHLHDAADDIDGGAGGVSDADDADSSFLMRAVAGAESKAISLLVGLGFTQDMLHTPVKSFR